MSNDIELPDATEYAHQVYLASIMEQLTQSERFMRFFKINYDVQTFVDDAEGTYNIRLIELAPEHANERLRELATEHAEEHMPRIETATMEEIQQIAKDTNGN